jgi:hypothetical protein
VSKQVTTVTLKDGTERVYESYPVEDYEALRAENERLREALENAQHGVCCPAQQGWLDKGPCTCGRDEALAGAAP